MVSTNINRLGIKIAVKMGVNKFDLPFTPPDYIELK
jgi:hypothetical protein